MGFPGTDSILSSTLRGAIEALQQISDFESFLADVRHSKPKLKQLRSSAAQALPGLSYFNLQRILNMQFSGVVRQTTTSVEDLREAIDSALDQLSDSQPGRPAEPRLRSAVLQLHALYRELHPDDRGITYQPTHDERYSGTFFCLLRDLCALIGIKRSPEAIGKQIELALKLSGTH